MKKQIVVFLMILFCLTGCSAEDGNPVPEEECAAPRAIAEHEFSVIQDFDNEVYGLTPKPTTAGLGESACEEADAEPATASDTMAFPEPESVSADSIIYTTFQPVYQSVSADDSTRLFISQSYIPVFFSDESETADWLNRQISTITDEMTAAQQALYAQAAASYQTDAGDKDPLFYAYSYYANINMGRQDGTVVSLLQSGSIYNGGMQPENFQYAYNFDLIKQQQLTLYDILCPDAVQKLLDQLFVHLDDQLTTLEETGFFENFKAVVLNYLSNPESIPYWYFSENGLVIHFNCSEFAENATGTIKAELRYDLLEGILLPEYFPEPITSTNPGFAILESPENLHTITVPSDDEGNSVLVCCTGTTHDVRLYRISTWVTDDNPIIGQMLFSANYLTENEVLKLTEPADLQNPAYILQYRDGAGERYQFAVSSQGIQIISNSKSE